MPETRPAQRLGGRDSTRNAVEATGDFGLDGGIQILGRHAAAYHAGAQQQLGFYGGTVEEDLTGEGLSQLGDMAGGSFSLFGLLTALCERSVTGKGKHVELAMLDSLIAMQGYLSQIYFVTGETSEPVGTKHPSIVTYGTFPTADGHVIFACLTESFWQTFARCLDWPELLEDPRFSAYQARLSHRAELEPLIEARMRQDTTEYWLARLAEFDVPSAAILSIGEALTQPHLAQPGLLGHATHPQAAEMAFVRSPIRYDGRSLDIGCPRGRGWRRDTACARSARIHQWTAPARGSGGRQPGHPNQAEPRPGTGTHPGVGKNRNRHFSKGA